MKKEVIVDKAIINLSYEEIIERYNKYIYKIINSYKYTFKPFENIYNIEDLYQECLIAGYKAYMAYDISKGYEIITIMNTYIRTNLNIIYRRLKTKTKDKIVVYFGDYDESYFSKELVVDDFSNDILLKLTVEEVTKNYNDKKIDCVKFLKNEISMTQFANKYKNSRAYLYKLKNIVIEDLKNKLN